MSVTISRSIWKKINIDKKLVGNILEKGSGYWAKKYRYILIPPGYGYDNYCFLLSENCINSTYFLLHPDMTIELFYNPIVKEPAKKYKRFRLTGFDLYEQIFKKYESNKLELEIQKEKKKKGVCVCGIYGGNYHQPQIYRKETTFKAYFKGVKDKCYFNNKYDKVVNVKCIFEISESMSRYDFNRLEPLMNKYLEEYQIYYDHIEILKDIKPTIPGLSKINNQLIKKQQKIIEEIEMMIKNKIKEELPV